MRLLLKINHILFWWYYSKVTEHFKGYTFFKSVGLLRQHYEHAEFVIKGHNQVIQTAIEENERLAKENSQLRISQIATDGQIRWANKAFGIDWTPPTEN
jgi:hypothetical protein